jgi:phosphodiesterase/alkaline phosphatase D-like protein
VTVIGAGLQILPYRYFEWMGESNRAGILDLIKLNEVSNVVIITGDVHHGGMYQTACQSMSGVHIIEATSSGLTENLDNFWDRNYGISA